MAKDRKARSGVVTRTEPSWFERLSSSRQDLLCVMVLYVILLLLFNKIVFDNMVFSDSGDTAAAQAWSAALTHIDQTEHVEPLWIPYIFSGMPSFGALSFPRMVNYIQDFLIA